MKYDMQLISREELKQKLERGDRFKLVMALGDWQYRAKHIPCSLHFPTRQEALAFINGGLLVFNLLPIYPLDGGQILQALLWFVIGRARSLKVVSIVGLRLSAGSAGPGMVASASFATHCFAPAGLSVSSHS